MRGKLPICLSSEELKKLIEQRKKENAKKRYKTIEEEQR